MAYDIYGSPLMPGHCEVHPDVVQEYPCIQCHTDNDNAGGRAETELPSVLRHRATTAEAELVNADSRIAELRDELITTQSALQRTEGERDEANRQLAALGQRGVTLAMVSQLKRRLARAERAIEVITECDVVIEHEDGTELIVETVTVDNIIEALEQHEAENDSSCDTCGGSGGGAPPFVCGTCGGTGQKRQEGEG